MKVVNNCFIYSENLVSLRKIFSFNYKKLQNYMHYDQVANYKNECYCYCARGDVSIPKKKNSKINTQNEKGKNKINRQYKL